jgi:acetylornithine/succinyldiaminopimelate/putrescine aminotransferase
VRGPWPVETGGSTVRAAPCKAPPWDAFNVARGTGGTGEVILDEHARAELARRGYIVARRPGQSVLRLDPALTIEQEHIEGFLETFDGILTGT